MATQQLSLVADCSTSANFNSWAKPISDWFRSCGYTNTTDTGQLNGVGGGHGGSAGWAALTTVPAAGSFYYEIFKSNTTYTTFYVKLEYGLTTSGGGSGPNVRISLGTGTNGSGTLTGFFFANPLTCHGSNDSGAPSTTTTFECDFHGDTTGGTDRIAILMWRNTSGTNQSSPLIIAIERSLNSSGGYTNSYVTAWTAGRQDGVSGNQQSIVFGVGAGPAYYANNNPGRTNQSAGWLCRMAIVPGGGTSAFNGNIPFDLAAPCNGYFDNCCTVVGVAWNVDLAEGVTFNTTLYSSTRTYMPTKNQYMANAAQQGDVGGKCFSAIRYD